MHESSRGITPPISTRGSRNPESVAGILDEWLEFIRLHRAEKTYDWYKDFAQSLLEALPKVLGGSCLRVHHVQKWVDTHVSTRSDSTRHGAITTIKAAMRWALKQGYIDLDSIAHMSKSPIAKRELLVPEKHYEYMVAKAKDQEFKALLTTCWEVGPRPQEVVAVEESKGKKCPQVVHLTDTVVEICKRLHKSI